MNQHEIDRLAAIEDILTKVADGDFDQRIETQGGDDSIGSLEIGINFMIMDLRAMVSELKEKESTLIEQASELELKLAQIQRQEAAIRQLTTPVIEIWNDVLALPIVGILDAKRSEELTHDLLRAITDKQCGYVIIDLTGVDLVDTQTADHLLKVVQAAELLGATCALTGLSPAVAQTLAELGADLDHIATLRSLKDGLLFCLKERRKKRTLEEEDQKNFGIFREMLEPTGTH